MATDLERLVVQLSADIKRYENALNRAMGQTNKRARSIERRFTAMNKNITSGFVGLGRSLAGAFAVAGGVRGIQTLLDASIRMENALKVTGLAGDELTRVYDKLFASAQKNLAPVDALVDLYSRLGISQSELGVTTDQMADFTDKVALALRVQGTTATEARGALIQLGQAMGEGVVRAQEFNSIIEQAPAIHRAAAAGLKEANGSVSELRRLMLDGRLSSRAYFDALLAGSVILDDKVKDAQITTTQGLTLLRNEMINAVGDFAKGSLAAEGLGDAFKIMADAINGVDFKEFGEQARELIGMINQIREAMGWLQNMGANLGSMLGTDALGDWATGGAAFKEFAGGALTITNQRGLQRRIDEAFGNAVDTAAGLTEEAIRQSAGTVTGTGKTGRLPSSAPSTVSLDDYEVPAGAKSGSGGGGRTKQRADEYERLSERIRESTEALRAETEVQAGLNPLVDDYGYAVEKARAEQELLSAAKKAGVEVTPKLRKEISDLAEQYALASAEADKLAEAQDKARENAERWLGVGQDVTKGFIDDLINGKSAAESFANAISKIGDALLDDVLSAIFKINGQGGGLLSSIFGLFGGTNWGALSASGKYLFDTGGYTGDGGKYQPKGVVHGGEYVFSKEAVQKAGVGNLEAMHRSLKGYASGGPVGMSIPRINPRAANDNRPQQMQINVNVDGANGDEHVIRLVQQGVSAGLQQYDRNVAPLTVKRVVNDPRQVG